MFFILKNADVLFQYTVYGIGLSIDSFLQIYRHFYIYFHRIEIKHTKTCKNMIYDRRDGLNR